MSQEHSRKQTKTNKNTNSKPVLQNEENEQIALAEVESAQPLTGSEAAINRAFYNGKLAGAQRQAVVQRLSQQGGNQQVLRMLQHNCTAGCGHQIARTPGSAIRRAVATPQNTENQEEKAPLQLSGIIKPTKLDGEAESFCDSTSGTVARPTLQRLIPELPNIIKSSKGQRQNRPLEVKFNLDMNQRAERSHQQPAHGHSHGSVMGHDEAGINSSFGVKTQTKNSGSVAATGEEIFGYASGRVFIDGSWTLSGNVLNVSATMHVIAYWAISGQGRERISGANDEKINSGTWADVIYDLQTDAEGVPLRRKLYYVPSITAAHELYHVHDIFKQANTYVPTAKAWLDTQTVHIPDTILGLWEDDKELVQFNLNTVLTDLSFKAEENIKAYIKNGGESRAYQAGKNAYDSLRGEIKQKAVDNGWTLPKSPEIRESLELKPGQKKL